MKRDLPLSRERLHQQLVKTSHRIPINITEVISRRVVLVGLELNAPQLTGAGDRGFSRPVTARRTHWQPQAVKTFEKGRIGDSHAADPLCGHPTPGVG